MAITNKSQLVDKTGIYSACSELDEVARDFKTTAHKVREAALVLNKDALCVGNKTMEKNISEVADMIESYQNKINKITDNIRTTTDSVYKKQTKELEDYNKKKTKQTYTPKKQINSQYDVEEMLGKKTVKSSPLKSAYTPKKQINSQYDVEEMLKKKK